MKRLLSVFALISGALVGLKFPDIDQRVDFLLHRSVLTHGPLIPIVLFLIIKRASKNRPLSEQSGTVGLFTMFLSLGFGVHLAFDLFPRQWYKHALISIPGYGWTPAVVSWIWIAFSTIFCAVLAARLARGLAGVGLFLFGTVVIFVYALQGEASFVGPLATVIVATMVAVFTKALIWRIR